MSGRGTIRSVEQKLLDIFAEGQPSSRSHLHGQEFTGVAVCAALRPSDIVYSITMPRTFLPERRCQRSARRSYGRQVGVGGAEAAVSLLEAFQNAHSGQGCPVAAGLASFETAQQSITVVHPHGTMGEGVLQAMNIISKRELPSGSS